MHPSGNKAKSNPISETITRILQTGSIAVLTTLLEAAENVGAKLIVEELGIHYGSLGARALDEAVIKYAARFLDSKEETRALHVKEFAPEPTMWGDAQILFERIQPAARLVICGAGHVGASLAKLAALMGYRATLIDDRAEFVTRERFPEQGIELVAAQSWAEAVHAAVGDAHGVSVAVVTRGHSEDEECMRAIMDAANPDYVGLIGSKRRTNIVLQRLRDKGAEEEKLQKVRAPIGLSIGAVTPEEVALAIMAEIVAVRRGGKGGSLSAWRRGNKSMDENPSSKP